MCQYTILCGAHYTRAGVRWGGGCGLQGGLQGDSQAERPGINGCVEQRVTLYKTSCCQHRSAHSTSDLQVEQCQVAPHACCYYFVNSAHTERCNAQGCMWNGLLLPTKTPWASKHTHHNCDLPFSMCYPLVIHTASQHLVISQISNRGGTSTSSSQKHQIRASSTETVAFPGTTYLYDAHLHIIIWCSGVHALIVPSATPQDLALHPPLCEHTPVSMHLRRPMAIAHHGNIMQDGLGNCLRPQMLADLSCAPKAFTS